MRDQLFRGDGLLAGCLAVAALSAGSGALNSGDEVRCGEGLGQPLFWKPEPYANSSNTFAQIVFARVMFVGFRGPSSSSRLSSNRRLTLKYAADRRLCIKGIQQEFDGRCDCACACACACAFRADPSEFSLRLEPAVLPQPASPPAAALRPVRCGDAVRACCPHQRLRAASESSAHGLAHRG